LRGRRGRGRRRRGLVAGDKSESAGDEREAARE
jgi:hypothetical protein